MQKKDATGYSSLLREVHNVGGGVIWGGRATGQLICQFLDSAGGQVIVQNITILYHAWGTNQWSVQRAEIRKRHPANNISKV